MIPLRQGRSDLVLLIAMLTHDCGSVLSPQLFQLRAVRLVARYGYSQSPDGRRSRWSRKPEADVRRVGAALAAALMLEDWEGVRWF